MTNKFILRYDGAEAAQHQLDMSQMGRSLIGIDSAIHKVMWVTLNPGVPQKRRRADISVRVTAPRPACVEIVGVLAGCAGVLPFMYDVATSLGADYIKHWLSSVVLHHGGRKSESDGHIQQMMQIYSDSQQLMANDRIDERRHVEAMQENLLAGLKDCLPNMQTQARQIVDPVGRSSQKMLISGSDASKYTEIDAAIADAVRTNGDLIVGDLETFDVRFDSQVRRNCSAKVEILDLYGGLVPAEIRDPTFDDFPNVYSIAYSNQDFIRIIGKLTKRNDAVVKLHIFSTI